MKALSLIGIALFASMSSLVAAPQEALLRMKSGEVKITLLDSDGIRPLDNIDVAVQNTREPVQVIHASTDVTGACAFTLADGTYGLAVAGKTVALIEAAADAETTHLRLVTPSKPLLIGGAEKKKNGKKIAKGAAPTNAVPTNVVADATGDAAGAGEAGHAGSRRGLFAWIGDHGLKTALLLGGVVATAVIVEDENDGPSRAETPAAGGVSPPASSRASRPSRPTTPDIDPPVSQ